MTNKALRMPLHAQGCNIVVHYWLFTSTTFGRKGRVVVVPTEWLSISLMETGVTKRLATLMAEEMLLMPSFVQGCHTGLNETHTRC